MTLGNAMSSLTFSNFTLVALIGICTALAKTSETNDYVKYSSYPPYCSTPTQMKDRSIPPIDATNQLVAIGGALKLLHVTNVIRHGARTPWDAHQCWETYDIYTDPWNCDLGTLIAPPTEASLAAKDTSNMTADYYFNDDVTQFNGQGEQLMFQKQYDAQYSPTGEHFTKNMRNVLGGTCQKGQLISLGYDQQVENGNILKNAYVLDNDESLNTHRDNGHLLFDFEEDVFGKYEDRDYVGSNLYFRADDFQRTLMSGQVLLQSLFGSLLKRHATWKAGDESEDDEERFNPVIEVHINDKETDTLYTNTNVCPRLTELKMDALNSEEYQNAFVESEKSIALKKMLDDNLGGSWGLEEPGTAVDCLMTTICNDRDLPDILDDYGKPASQQTPSEYGQNRFEQVADDAISKDAFVWNYNGAAYAKLAMTPLWSDILFNIIHDTDIPGSRPDLRDHPPKFALFSAHDSTLMGLLSSLDIEMDLNTHWPPYASMFLIELYSIDTTHLSPSEKLEVYQKFPSLKVFRMIYNGEVITPLMATCSEELCDIVNLTSHIAKFADISKWDDECKVTTLLETIPSSPPLPTNTREVVHSHGMSITGIVSLCILCTMIGIMITYIKMEKMWREYNKAQREVVVPMELDVAEVDACGVSRVYGVVPTSPTSNNAVIT